MIATIRKGLIAALLIAQAMPALAAEPASAAPKAELSKDPREAALTCYWSSAARMAGARDQTEVISEAIWYLLEYLRTQGPAGDTLDQVQAMSGEEFSPDKVTGTAAGLRAVCQGLNPRNDAAAPVTLPADTFQRDTLCMAVTSLLVGFARSEQQDTGRSALLDPATALMDRLALRLDDPILAAHGYVGDAAVTALISASLRTAGTYGNLTGVFRACTAAVPA